MKKAIINKFGEHGINYQERKSKIPETVLEMIKKYILRLGKNMWQNTELHC